jgi:hypothetical protein
MSSGCFLSVLGDPPVPKYVDAKLVLPMIYSVDVYLRGLCDSLGLWIAPRK